MKNLEIAAMFERTAEVMSVIGENSFRVLAYKKIARALEDLPHDVAEIAKTGGLEDIPGIGASSAEKIREYLRTGTITEFQSIWSQVPAGVMEMIKIPSVGAKTAALLWHHAGIQSVQELKDAIDAGKLTDIPSLGQKKLDKIKLNISFLSQSSGRVRIGRALPLALEWVGFLRSLPGVERAEYGGSLRRGKETIGDIDIAVAADEAHAPAIAKAVASHHLTSEVIGSGDTKTSVRTAAGIQVDVRVVPLESFGAAMQYFTGSLAHNVRLRTFAVAKGLKLNEWGVYQGDKMLAGKSEEEVYATLGLACLPPEMREDHGEIELAQKLFSESAPAKPKAKSPAPVSCAATYPLIEIADIRGDLHTHTVASDGSHSIEEMVAEAKRRGYQYIAITDHSKSQFQANGLKSDRLLQHIEAIHVVAREVKNILVLAGSEVDILADGSLDYEDDLLAKLDWVVASPHAALTQESDAATDRLVRAAANPHVCVIGHPTGRLVMSRRGLEPDMKKVIFAAARNGIALEINSNNHRLDLRDSHAKLAVDAGVPPLHQY